jgi:hypothetical protein
MAVVILADIMENSYYDGPFNPDTPASPVVLCVRSRRRGYGAARKGGSGRLLYAPEPECSDCPRNEWGSADVGRGKACKNVMRLALIPAGQYKGKGTGRNANL